MKKLLLIPIMMIAIMSMALALTEQTGFQQTPSFTTSNFLWDDYYVEDWVFDGTTSVGFPEDNESGTYEIEYLINKAVVNFTLTVRPFCQDGESPSLNTSCDFDLELWNYTSGSYEVVDTYNQSESGFDQVLTFSGDEILNYLDDNGGNGRLMIRFNELARNLTYSTQPLQKGIANIYVNWSGGEKATCEDDHFFVDEECQIDDSVTLNGSTYDYSHNLDFIYDDLTFDLGGSTLNFIGDNTITSTDLLGITITGGTIVGDENQAGKIITIDNDATGGSIGSNPNTISNMVIIDEGTGAGNPTITLHTQKGISFLDNEIVSNKSYAVASYNPFNNAKYYRNTFNQTSSVDQASLYIQGEGTIQIINNTFVGILELKGLGATWGTNVYGNTFYRGVTQNNNVFESLNLLRLGDGSANAVNNFPDSSIVIKGEPVGSVGYMLIDKQQTDLYVDFVNYGGTGEVMTVFKDYSFGRGDSAIIFLATGTTYDSIGGYVSDANFTTNMSVTGTSHASHSFYNNNTLFYLEFEVDNNTLENYTVEKDGGSCPECVISNNGETLVRVETDGFPISPTTTTYELIVVGSCVEDWVYGVEPTECSTGNQTIVYTDANACGTVDDLPVDNGTTISCTVPTAPTILTRSPLLDPTVTAGNDQNFSVTISEVDGDTVSYEWSVDGIDQSNNESWLNIDTSTLSGVVTVAMNVTDKDGTDTTSWTMTVNVAQSITGYVPAYESEDLAPIVIDGTAKFLYLIYTLVALIGLVSLFIFMRKRFKELDFK